MLVLRIVMATGMSRGTLLQAALDVKRSAQSFYAELASKFKEYEKTFAKFSDDEGKHTETYSRLLKEKGGTTSAAPTCP